MNTIILLFLSSLLAGISVLAKPTLNKVNFKFILSFSGAFLFSSTLLHLLPEAFELGTKPVLTGAMVLVGFYFQIFIELFTEGVEHGHIHIHKPHQLKSISLIAALCIHAFIEGMIIIHHHETGEHEHNNNSLILGLIIHKIPETIALVSVLISNQISRKSSLIILLFFSAVSPIGALLSNIFIANSSHFYGYIMALVAGNFLYISTTIFFESNPEHKVQIQRMTALFLGAICSFIIEYFL